MRTRWIIRCLALAWIATQAHADGVLRHFGARRDGTPRDIAIYSILANEWPDVRRHLELRLTRAR